MSTTSTIQKHTLWRAAFLTALANFKLSGAAATAAELRATLAQLPTVIGLDDSDDHDGLPFVRDEPTEDPVSDVVRVLTEATAFVMEWVDALRRGDAGASARLYAAHALAFTAAEEFRAGAFPQFEFKVRAALQAIQDVQGLGNVSGVVQALQALPVPYRHPERRMRFVPSPPAAPSREVSGPYVVKVAFEVDGRAWNAVQVFRKGMTYDLHSLLTVPVWPPGASSVRLEHITTLAPGQYHLHLPPAPRPTDSAADDTRLTGSVIFHDPQSLSSVPLLLQLRATFEMDDGTSMPGVLVGYHELRAHVLDERLAPVLSGYRSLDKRLLDLIIQVKEALPDVDRHHLQDFVGVLTALGNFQSLNMQQGLYRRGEAVNEAQFQQRLLEHLRTLLGEDVREAPRQGSGITDVQYRSVTVELKVEKSVKDRRKVIDGYLSQPTQYTSAGGGQLGILYV